VRASSYFAPTLREVPAEAEIPSHKLLLRAGYLRKLGAGVYTYLPLAWKVIRKMEQVLREEQEVINCAEMRMPTLVPKELMEETGRWGLDVVYKLQDRRKADFALGFTHEEVITDLARQELRSWRDLPVMLYQVQTKFRDEPRPRGGVIRTREFLMFDAYSFDRDVDAMDTSYKAQRTAYERFFQRIGLRYLIVDADGGAIGDLDNQEFMSLADAGEDTVLTCDSCSYAANAEKCPVNAPAASETAPSVSLEEVHTPNARTIDEVAAFLGTASSMFIKTLIYSADGKPVVVLVRGDHTVNDVKLARLVGAAELELAPEAMVVAVTGAPVGFAGPVGLTNVPIYADHAVTVLQNAVTGANKADFHITGVDAGRDFTWTVVADIRVAEDGDSCPMCASGTMRTTRGIEIGHIFKLGDKYSKAMQLDVTGEDGKLQAIQMGCYGIGMSRSLAAIVEASHDKDGIIWPISVAPFEVSIVVAARQDDAQYAAADAIYTGMKAAGLDVYFDDRDERAGVKFKDADLMGCPIRVVVGKGLTTGVVEVKQRGTDVVETVALADIIQHVTELKQLLLDALKPVTNHA
jgi:prolyl-tRNA synthetase